MPMMKADGSQIALISAKNKKNIKMTAICRLKDYRPSSVHLGATGN